MRAVPGVRASAGHGLWAQGMLGPRAEPSRVGYVAVRSPVTAGRPPLEERRRDSGKYPAGPPYAYFVVQETCKSFWLFDDFF